MYLTGFLRLPTDAPIVTNVTTSSAVIKWQQVTDVPDDLSDYYQYFIEYKEESSSSWVELQTGHSHNSSLDQYQAVTLSGLMYNTVYDVQVESYRTHKDRRQETESTRDITFKTLCRGL